MVYLLRIFIFLLVSVGASGFVKAEVTHSVPGSISAFLSDYLQAHKEYSFPQCKRFNGRSLPSVDASIYRKKFADALRDQYRNTLVDSLGYYQGAQDCLQMEPKYSSTHKVLTRNQYTELKKVKVGRGRRVTKTQTNTYEVKSPFKNMQDCMNIGAELRSRYDVEYGNQRIFIAESSFLDFTHDEGLMREFLDGAAPPLDVSSIGRQQNSKLGLSFTKYMEPLSERELNILRFVIKSQMLEFTEYYWSCGKSSNCAAALEECRDNNGTDYFPSFKMGIKCQNMGKRWLAEYRRHRDSRLESEFALARDAIEEAPWMGFLTDPVNKDPKVIMKDVNKALAQAAELSRQSLQKIDSLKDADIYTLARNKDHMVKALDALTVGSSIGRVTEGELQYYCSIAESTKNKLQNIELGKDLFSVGLALSGVATCAFSFGAGCVVAAGVTGMAADGYDWYRLSQKDETNYKDYISKLRGSGAFKTNSENIKLEKTMVAAGIPASFLVGHVGKRYGKALIRFFMRQQQSLKAANQTQSQDAIANP